MKDEAQFQNKYPDYVDGVPIREIVQAVKSVSFGDVRIVIQDSKVVQIDKTEKVRVSR